MEFEGWIPNATGNVSFSAIGEPITDGLLFSQHFWSSTSRWLILAQLRRNRDRQVPRVIAAMWRGISRAWNFVAGSKAKPKRYDTLLYLMLAQSGPVGGDPEGALDGTIMIVLPDTAEYGGAQTKGKEIADTLRRATDEYRTGFDATPPTDTRWRDDTAKLLSYSVFSCSFRMLRTGKCFFFVDEKKHPLGERILLWLSSQCYYFLKGAVHQHYHHGASTDAIIELTQTGATPDWRLRTLRNLYRKVISLRRSLDDELLSDALGVMAYASVFTKLFGKKDIGRNNNEIHDVAELPTYHPEELKASIEIRRETSRRHFDSRKSDVQYIIGSAIALAALYVATYSLFQKDSPAKGVADAIGRLISAQPLVMLMPVILFYVFYRLYTGAHDLTNEGIHRTIYRLFAWLPKSVFLLLGLLAVLLFLGGLVASMWQIARLVA